MTMSAPNTKHLGSPRTHCKLDANEGAWSSMFSVRPCPNRVIFLQGRTILILFALHACIFLVQGPPWFALSCLDLVQIQDTGLGLQADSPHKQG